MRMRQLAILAAAMGAVLVLGGSALAAPAIGVDYATTHVVNSTSSLLSASMDTGHSGCERESHPSSISPGTTAEYKCEGALPYYSARFTLTLGSNVSSSPCVLSVDTNGATIKASGSGKVLCEYSGNNIKVKA